MNREFVIFVGSLIRVSLCEGANGKEIDYIDSQGHNDYHSMKVIVSLEGRMT